MSVDLKEQVRQVMIDHLCVDSRFLTDTASFSNELGLDSLDAMDLLVAVDEAFGIRIPLKDMESIDTLNDLVNVVLREQKQAV